MKRLHSLDTREVSIVPKGANKKKWLVLKSAIKDNPVSADDLNKVFGCEPDTMSKVDTLIKEYGGLGRGFDEEESEVSDGVDKKEAMKAKLKAAAQKKIKTAKGMGTEPQPGETPQDDAMDGKMAASLKAAVRILGPHKGKLPKDLLLKVLDAAGLMDDQSDGGEDMATKQGSSRQSPEPIKDEHKIEAMKVAKEAAGKAFKDHLEKLGYQKYPEAEMEQKADTDPDEPGQDEEQEGTMNNPDKKSADEKDDMCKSVQKSLLSKVPKESRPAIESIFKAHQEMIEKNESLTRQVEQMARREVKREFIAKAEKMAHLGMEKDALAETLITLSQKAPEEYAKIEKALLTGSETIQKSALFSELGSNIPDNSTGIYDRIEKAAEGWVQKSGQKMSKEAAFEAYITTSEGRRMYNDYINQHASGRRN